MTTLDRILTALAFANAGNFREFTTLLDTISEPAAGSPKKSRQLRLVPPARNDDAPGPVANMWPSHR
ncbi:hypothetical protein [Thiobacter aerophilum]|uniref:Transposase n=1 Tax=Thiobacter aerophilum TaxID=3121275 RepID=A0ABV0EBJ7_9BURK